jgi:anti-sigma B factor antagonist
MDDLDQRHRPPPVDGRGIRPPDAYAIQDGPGAVGVGVLVLEGELDIAAAPTLAERFEAVGEGEALVVDFSSTTFVDSSVLRELLRARERLAARGTALVLAAVAGPVRRLLDLTGTAELFVEAPDAETAVRRLSG